MTDIQPFDFQRIFLGQQPTWFFLEITFRTVVLYIYALALIQSTGRRTIGQLSVVEFLLVIALGSATGDPMFYPEVPLTHGMLTITVTVLLNRITIWLLNRSETAERALEGVPRVLIEAGCMVPAGMEAARLNREKLFELLRLEGVRQLGELETVFMEQGGALSVYRYDKDAQKPGLRVVPPWDLVKPRTVKRLEDAQGRPLGCRRCGHVAASPDLSSCPECEGDEWLDAVVQPGESINAVVSQWPEEQITKAAVPG